LRFEGVVSKTIDAPYAPGNRSLWRKAKCLNRQEFVVVGWTDPEGSRPHLGALLLGYYTDEGRLIYAGRVGTGMPDKVLGDLRRRLEPLASGSTPLSAPPPSAATKIAVNSLIRRPSRVRLSTCVSLMARERAGVGAVTAPYRWPFGATLADGSNKSRLDRANRCPYVFRLASKTQYGHTVSYGIK